MRTVVSKMSFHWIPVIFFMSITLAGAKVQLLKKYEDGGTYDDWPFKWKLKLSPSWLTMPSLKPTMRPRPTARPYPVHTPSHHDDHNYLKDSYFNDGTTIKLIISVPAVIVVIVILLCKYLICKDNCCSDGSTYTTEPTFHIPTLHAPPPTLLSVPRTTNLYDSSRVSNTRQFSTSVTTVLNLRALNPTSLSVSTTMNLSDYSSRVSNTRQFSTSSMTGLREELFRSSTNSTARTAPTITDLTVIRDANYPRSHRESSYAPRTNHMELTLVDNPPDYAAVSKSLSNQNEEFPEVQSTRQLEPPPPRYDEAIIRSFI